MPQLYNVFKMWASWSKILSFQNSEKWVCGFFVCCLFLDIKQWQTLWCSSQNQIRLIPLSFTWKNFLDIYYLVDMINKLFKIVFTQEDCYWIWKRFARYRILAWFLLLLLSIQLLLWFAFQSALTSGVYYLW